MPRPDSTPPIRAHQLSPATLRRPTPVALTGWADSSGWALRYVDPSVITPADDSPVDRCNIATFAAVIPATGRRGDQAWPGCDHTFAIRVRRDRRLDAATHRRDLSDIV